MSFSRFFVVVTTACVMLIADAALGQAPNRKRSGFDDMSLDTQAMQTDDTANPGMLWVLEGEALWSVKTGALQKACSDCHGNAADTMKGVAARYPAWDANGDVALDIDGRILQCRKQRQGAPAATPESHELLALTAYVAHQSRGLPVAPSDDPHMTFVRERGRTLFQQRQGQLNLSCAACHDHNDGHRLGGSTVPQGHPSGYPLYRLEWQSLGSLYRRLRNCMIGVRAEPFPYGSEDLVALEAYLMDRASTLKMETPAVRP